jgi:hypothetical protein
MALDITPRAPFGSLLKTGKPTKKVARTLGRDPRQHDKDHLEALRQCPCLSCGADPCGEAAHVRMTVQGRPNPGMQKKPHDIEAVPLCRLCHTEQHRGAEQDFWKPRGIDPMQVAAALAKLSPNAEAMRAVIFNVRAAVALGRTTMSGD